MSKIKYNVRNSAIDYSDKLGDVYLGIQKESTLLHPTLDLMIKSYRSGKAALMVDQDKEKVVGYIRLTELLNNELKIKLGIDITFPNIEEIGTAIILNDPTYRNKGYYPGLRNLLIASQLTRLESEELLIIGTTKNSKVISALDAAKDLGIQFNIHPHFEFKNLAAFTCTCLPSFGTGLQISETCESRIESNKAELIQLSRTLGSKNKIQLENRIKCTMYVSNTKLARRMDEELGNLFEKSSNLVAKLKEVKYYG